MTLFTAGLGLYLCQVQLPDFATDIFSQAAGKRDHTSQLTGVSSNQLQIGPVEQRHHEQTAAANSVAKNTNKECVPHPLQCQHLGVNGALLSDQSVQFKFHFFLQLLGKKHMSV